MVDQNLILIGYAVPLVFGLLMMTKAGDGLSDALSQRSPLLAHARRRHMLGMNLVALMGFVVSVHTLWISNKISEGANVCSTATVFSCDDVLGNAQYNVDPFFGISWGLIGMFAFGAILFITNSVGKEPDALWAESYMKYGMYMTGAGMLVIALLVSYESSHGENLSVLYDGSHRQRCVFVRFLESRKDARCWRMERRRPWMKTAKQSLNGSELYEQRIDVLASCDPQRPRCHGLPARAK